ncbi:MAG: glycyl-radical enzyme activating protein [Clostridia bacterium]|nr:glycyl-radical enzyme activating protein [Clostridia bacterium]
MTVIFDIKHFAVHDGPGIRTTVFFKGCSLKCIWCHNPEGICAKPTIAYFAHKCIGCRKCEAVCGQGVHIFENGTHILDKSKCMLCGKCVVVCPGDALTIYGKDASTDELLEDILKDKDFYECSGGGVTLSGGEALLQADFCAELLKKLKENGIHTAVDTCGNVPRDAFDKVLPYTDLFLYDMKHIDGDEHKHLTGASNKLILENLEYITQKGAKVEIRIPLVPGHNDSDDVINGIGAFLGKLTGITKVKVLPYHAFARSKYDALGMKDTLPDVPSPTNDILRAVAEKLKAYGLNAVSGKD